MGWSRDPWILIAAALAGVCALLPTLGVPFLGLPRPLIEPGVPSAVALSGAVAATSLLCFGLALGRSGPPARRRGPALIASAIWSAAVGFVWLNTNGADGERIASWTLERGEEVSLYRWASLDADSRVSVYWCTPLFCQRSTVYLAAPKPGADQFLLEPDGRAVVWTGGEPPVRIER